jgi:hypothetical protein
MVGPGIINTSVANRRSGYTVETREIRIGGSRCPDVVDFGAVEPSSGSNRGRDRYRKYVSWLVGSWGRISPATTTVRLGRRRQDSPSRPLQSQCFVEAGNRTNGFAEAAFRVTGGWDFIQSISSSSSQRTAFGPTCLGLGNRPHASYRRMVELERPVNSMTSSIRSNLMIAPPSSAWSTRPIV